MTSHINIAADSIVSLDSKGNCSYERQIDLLGDAGYSTDFANLPNIQHRPKQLNQEKFCKSSEKSASYTCSDNDFDDDFGFPDLPFKNVMDTQAQHNLLHLNERNPENSFNDETASRDNTFNSIESKPTDQIKQEESQTESCDTKLHESERAEDSIIDSQSIQIDFGRSNSDTYSSKSTPLIVSSTPKDHVVLLESDGTIHSEHKVDLLKEVGYTEGIGNLQQKCSQNVTEQSEFERLSASAKSGASGNVLEKDPCERFNEYELPKEGEPDQLNDSDDSTLLQNFFVMDGLPFDVDSEDKSQKQTVTKDSLKVENPDFVKSLTCDTISSDSLSKPTQIDCDQVNSSSNNNDAPPTKKCDNSDSALCDSVFDTIPYELIQKIFSYLSLKELCLNAALVCRKWNEYVNDPVHWTTLSVGSTHPVSSYQLAQIIQKSPFLRKLSLHGKFDLTADELLYIARNCPLLRELDLGFVVTIDPECIFNVAHYCLNLEELNVEGCVLVDNLCLR